MSDTLNMTEAEIEERGDAICCEVWDENGTSSYTTKIHLFKSKSWFGEAGQGKSYCGRVIPNDGAGIVIDHPGDMKHEGVCKRCQKNHAAAVRESERLDLENFKFGPDNPGWNRI